MGTPRRTSIERPCRTPLPPEADSGAPHGRVVAASDFKSAPCLPGPHLPTIWATVCRPTPAVDLTFERLELPDGDFVDLAWTQDNGGPVVLVLHGLEGCHESTYARAILARIQAVGYHGVLLQFRGCSGGPNRLDRNYHSGDTGDAAHVAGVIEKRYGRPLFAAIGYSLGGNVVLKWLGELAGDARLTTAVAVSVPFDLGACATRLNQGFSRFYQWRLIRSMRRKYQEKFARRPSPLAIEDVRRLRTFWSYDDAVTAPLHGFRDVHDYYASSSSRSYLKHIEVPTLILHADNDPFVPAAAVPSASELSPKLTLEMTNGGGHVGFVAGRWPWRLRYWLDDRIVSHLNEHRAQCTAGANVR